ncbi:MAG TPA: glycosyltransferase family 87 protein [Candidatus Dormibacteraeota bacterium]|nr:glycosyltransferase family 87 protein [Candidatus Dormibacteraeota bacterium]
MMAAVLAAINLTKIWAELSHPQYDDFRDFYVAARLGMLQGWAHLYDLNGQQRLAEHLGLGSGWGPFVNPPPMAWMLAPLSLLPYRPAFWCWAGMLTLMLVLTWIWAAPGAGRWRWGQLCLLLAFFVVAAGVIEGQAVPIILAGVAGAWRLLRGGRQTAAGLALLPILFKPHIAFLIPIALVSAGYRRCFLVWVSGTTILVLGSIASLGSDGLGLYAHAIGVLIGSAQLDIPLRRLISDPVALGVVDLLTLVLMLIIARRSHSPEPAIVAGSLGSLLIAPHLNPQDFALLVLAGWLSWRMEPRGRWVTILLAAGTLTLLTAPATRWWLPVVLLEILALALLTVRALPIRAYPNPARQPSV